MPQQPTAPLIPTFTDAQANEAFTRLVRESHTAANRNRRNGQPEVDSPLEIALRDAAAQNVSPQGMAALRTRIGRYAAGAYADMASTNATAQAAGYSSMGTLPQRSIDLVQTFNAIGNVPGLDAVLTSNTEANRTALQQGVQGARNEQVLMLDLLSQGVSPAVIARTHNNAVRNLPANATADQRSATIVQGFVDARRQNPASFNASTAHLAPLSVRTDGAATAINTITSRERTNLRRGGVNGPISPNRMRGTAGRGASLDTGGFNEVAEADHNTITRPEVPQIAAITLGRNTSDEGRG